MNDVHFYLGASLTEFKNRWNSVCPIYVAVHTMALFKSGGTLEAKSEVFNITIETKRCKSGVKRTQVASCVSIYKGSYSLLSLEMVARGYRRAMVFCGGCGICHYNTLAGS